MLKKVLCILLALLLLASAAVGIVFYKKRSAKPEEETIEAMLDVQAGETVTFGSYPQELVTDEALIGELEKCTFTWIDYEYYRDSAPHTIMEYADVMLEGEKYRAVRINSYRLTSTVYYDGSMFWDDEADSRDSLQDDNGYTPDNIYWFRYVPLRWMVMDPQTGMAICANIVDSQPFNNVAYNNSFAEDDYEQYADLEYTVFANDYSVSAIREWLNTDFLKTAFSAREQNNLRKIKLNGERESLSREVEDLVFLPSFRELISGGNVGLFDQNTQTFRVYPDGTDYAACQGYAAQPESEASYLMTRSSYSDWSSAVYTMNMNDTSVPESECSVTSTYTGICPLIYLSGTDTSGSDVSVQATAAEAADNNTVRFGSYPQTQVKNADLLKQLNAQELNWQSYAYYCTTVSESGEESDPEQGDFMQYADVTLDGSRYRAVRFSQYRYKAQPGTISSDMSDEEEWSQYNNGYKPDTVYWFRFEPLEWTVLDAKAGLLISKQIPDAQPFCAVLDRGEDTEEETEPEEETVPAPEEPAEESPVRTWWKETFGKTDNENEDDYEDEYEDQADYTDEIDVVPVYGKYSKSSIRTWLNSTFFSTAFSKEEQQKIKLSDVQTPGVGKQFPDCEDTDVQDKVYLLSYQEVQNEEYGMNPRWFESTPNRSIRGTDYALCQGLEAYENGCSRWFLRTALFRKEACFVSWYGYVRKPNTASSGMCLYLDEVSGIRPVIRVDPKILQTE